MWHSSKVLPDNVDFSSNHCQTVCLTEGPHSYSVRLDSNTWPWASKSVWLELRPTESNRKAPQSVPPWYTWAILRWYHMTLETSVDSLVGKVELRWVGKCVPHTFWEILKHTEAGIKSWNVGKIRHSESFTALMFLFVSRNCVSQSSGEKTAQHQYKWHGFWVGKQVPIILSTI